MVQKKNLNDHAYEKYVSTQLLPLGHRNAQQDTQNHIELFEQFLPKDKNSRLLDLGCGMGEFLLSIRKLGYSFIDGIDLSKECVEHCHHVGLTHVQKSTILSHLQERIAQYDCISLIDVLEHIPKEELLQTVQSIHTALRKEGRVILRVPNMDSPFVASSTHYGDLTHVSGFTMTSLRQLLEIAGYSHIAFFPQEVQTPRNILKRYLVKYPVKLCLRWVYYAFSYRYPTIDTENLICVAWE